MKLFKKLLYSASYILLLATLWTSLPLQADPIPATAPSTEENAPTAQTKPVDLGPVINFNNISMVEFLRFVSKLTGKNFVFDPQDLQFAITIISESEVSLNDVMAMLIQNLRIHDFDLIEQGSNFIIHKSKTTRAPAGVFNDKAQLITTPQIATSVFHINYVDPARVGAIVKTMVSSTSIVELIPESKRLIVTDDAANIEKIKQLLSTLDSPQSGLDIGQYVATNASPLSLMEMTQQLLAPVTAGQTFVLVPHAPSNSVFVVSAPFLVEKALSVMQKIDTEKASTGIEAVDSLEFKKKEKEEKKEPSATTGVSPDLKIKTAELHKLSPQELRNALKTYGFTDEDIDSMSIEEMRKELKTQIQVTLDSVELEKEQEINKKEIFESTLPLGQTESTHFFIYQLQYRKAEEIIAALRAIALSFQPTGKEAAVSGGANTDLAITLNTLQPIPESNSIVFTGTNITLKKVKELVNQIDVPVRQVYIEMLVLDTTLSNALNFGVQWGAKMQRRNLALEGVYNAPQSNTINSALKGVTNVPVPPDNPPSPHASFPSSVYDLTPNTLMGNGSEGFTAGSIGRKILFNGHGFMSMAGLINALRTDDDTKIILAPKITVEHNVPAEMNVGQQIGIKTSSVVNNNSTNVTQNYQLQNTGVILKVTALISSKKMVTLIISQEISAASQAQINNQQNGPPATINQTKALTRVHMPSDHFLVLGGLVNDTTEKTKSQIPCLGSLPIIGNLLFSNNTGSANKRTIMLFIRPHIIDSEEDMDRITKAQQDMTKKKSQPGSKHQTPVDDLKEMLNF